MIVLGWIAIHGLFAIAGGTVLAALGLIRPTWRGMLLALGPSYVTGVACVVVVLIALMVVGLAFTDLTLLVVVAGLAAGFAAVAMRRGAWIGYSDRQSPHVLGLSIGPSCLSPPQPSSSSL